MVTYADVVPRDVFLESSDPKDILELCKGPTRKVGSRNGAGTSVDYVRGAGAGVGAGVGPGVMAGTCWIVGGRARNRRRHNGLVVEIATSPGLGELMEQRASETFIDRR